MSNDIKLPILIAFELIFGIVGFLALRKDFFRLTHKEKRTQESNLLFLTFLGPLGSMAALLLPSAKSLTLEETIRFWLTAAVSLLLHALDWFLLLR